MMRNSATILLAENEPDDALLIQTALEEVGVEHPVQLVPNGQEAIHYLAGEGKFADRTMYPFPKLLLLDLIMPIKSGFDVLRWLDQHRKIKEALVIVVLTSAVLPEEMETVHELDVQSVLEKPLHFETLLDEMRSLKEQWLGDSQR